VTEPDQPKPWVPEPAAAAPAPSVPAAQDGGAAAPAGAADRPEVPVAASFAGGFLLALLIRRLAR
jgi:hypothetical protein